LISTSCHKTTKDAAIRYSILSDDTFPQLPPNAGEYHTRITPAACPGQPVLLPSKTLNRSPADGLRRGKLRLIQITA
jgi:hypothetical protein